MSRNTIIDLQFFINSQRILGAEIILGEDTNKTTNCKFSNIIKLCCTCKLYDPITMKHGTETELNNYSRGSGRIDFKTFCALEHYFHLFLMLGYCPLARSNFLTTEECV